MMHPFIRVSPVTWVRADFVVVVTDIPGGTARITTETGDVHIADVSGEEIRRRLDVAARAVDDQER